MKKLLAITALTLTIASSIPTASASPIPRNLIASDVHSAAHPNNARVQGATHHFEIYVQSSALSALSIDIPEGVAIREGIEVKNQSGQEVAAKVSIEGRKAILVFSEPIPVGTTLSIEMKGAHTQYSQGKTWLYHISGTLAGTNQEIPLGARYVKTYR